MSNPTFDSTDLTTKAPHCRIGTPQARAYTETMPGVNGMFAQLHGQGGRRIMVTGILIGDAQATAALALEDLMDEIRTLQDMADGATVEDFDGTDGEPYENCLLMGYNYARIHMTMPTTTTYQAMTRISADLINLTP